MDKQILVIGGGIAGVQAALDLAQMGVRAILVEEQPSIGGRMAQLDKTFPTNDCSTCILSPKLVELADHPNADILAYSVLQDLTRTDDGFEATVLRKARYVDPEKCTNCGLCSEKCPVKIPDPFNMGIAETKCIGIPYAQAVPPSYTINRDHCLYLNTGKCGVCKKVCPADAIDYEQKDTLDRFNVSAVIVAAGGEEYSPRIRPEYGYGLYPNVITSMEFERLLSASGPTAGQVLKPSDKQHPKRIAFIQCVGSRDIATGERGYCSAYCCMQATKEAIVAWEHDRDAQATIFYIDIRAFGKDFDNFVDRAKNECGVRYVQSRIAEIIENPKANGLMLKSVSPDGAVHEEEFDLVVLSVGLQVSPRVRKLLSAMGVTPDQHGFCPGTSFSPGETNVPGIYVCGTLTGPMDIPETVVSASSAAATAVRGALTPEKAEVQEEPEPEESPAPVLEPSPMDFDESPRIGVFVCRCGVNIASVVDVPAVVAMAETLPNVRWAEEMTYACSQSALRTIRERIEEHRLNRLVVASCSPRTHEKVFRGALRAAGLNEYLLQMTNIRDQCSWVHRDEPEAATAKATELVRMAVGKARTLTPLETVESDVRKSCLVIGGGVAGMVAALAVAENGFPAYLIEREEQLGGHAAEMRRTLDEENLPAALETLVASVENHPLIEVYKGAEIQAVSGFIGQFATRFSHAGEEKTLEHGTVIVATGAREHIPQSYGYGTDPCIVTQREFEHMLECKHPLLRIARSIAMIQCVDSREGDRPMCSRVCCGEAIKNALRFRAEYPRKDAYVFYRDMRTYGLLESYYTKARESGTVFVRFDVEQKPEVKRNGRGDFIIEVFDSIVGKQISIPAQIVVLSAGMDPEPGNRDIAKMLKVPLGENGYFHEAHVKLRPVEFATDGVFLCGLAHGPKYIGESVAQARAAASRALTVMTQDTVHSEGNVAMVDENSCNGCGICADVCAYKAIEIVEEKAVVNELICKGCGSCAAACLSGAIDLRGFGNKQIIKEFEELFI